MLGAELGFQTRMEAESDNPEIKGGWAKAWSLDLRSLAMFRVALAVLILYDLWDRAANLAAHYGESGVMPRGLLLECFGASSRLSPYFYASGSTSWIAALFIITAIAAIFLLIGLRTRWAVVGLWLLMLSLHRRNPLVNHGGDTLLVLLLFWSMFLPLGARWSFDAVIGGVRLPNQRSIVSVATVAFILQLCLLYWMTAAHKSGAKWRDGTAVYFALHLDMYATPFAVWLREQRALLPALTWGVLAFEFVGPLLAIMPFWTSRLRMIAAALFFAMHIGLAISLLIGTFPFVCMIAWLALLPGPFWDALLGWRSLVRIGKALTAPLRWAAQRATRLADASGFWRRLLRSNGRIHPPGMFAKIAVCTCLAYIIIQNASRLELPGARLLRSGLFETPGRALGIYQRWEMFAPEPAHNDYWVEPTALLADGKALNPLTGQGVSWSIDPPYVSRVPASRWRIFLRHLVTEDIETQHIRERFVDYLNEQRQTLHPDEPQFIRAEIWAVTQLTYTDRIEPTKRRLYQSKSFR